MAERRALRTLFGASRRLGGPRLWDLFRGGRVKILMYHGIPTRERFDGVENHWRYNVPLREFERQMRYLATRCNVVSLRDFLAGRGLSSRRTNVIITFDDGYGNNYTNAFPVLERFGLPALFAVTSGFVADRTPLWNDLVEYAVQWSPRSEVSLDWEGERRAFDLRRPGGRLELYNWLLRMSVVVDQAKRDALLQETVDRLGVEADRDSLFHHEDYRPLTLDELRRLARSDLVEIASHSVHHYLLKGLDRAGKRRELRESRATLEELTGRPCTAFCMPGGMYDDEVLEEAFEAGYDVVLTSDVGVARPGARVLNRNGVFSRDTLDWFVDMVHGPVGEVLEATRRMRHRRRIARAGGAS